MTTMWALSLTKINCDYNMDKWVQPRLQWDVTTHPYSNFIGGWAKVNILRPRQNGRHFTDDTFKRIFLNKTFRISIKISLKFVPKGPINNISALVQIIAWLRSGDKPLSEPLMVRLLTHICVTRPQWVQVWMSNYIPLVYMNEITYLWPKHNAG